MIGYSEILFFLFGLFFIVQTSNIKILSKRSYNKNKFGKLLEDKNVNFIGNKILKANNIYDSNISFYVLISDSINAFATDNNKIYLTKGILELLSNREKMVAAVLAHEIAHITKEHIKKHQKFIFKIGILSWLVPKGIFGQCINYIFKGAAANYSKENEFEADSLGITYLYNAGYNPLNLYITLKTIYNNSIDFKSPIDEFLDSHPISTERLKVAKSVASNF